MKRKRITKPISLMLIIAMVFQMIVVPGLFGGNMEVEAAETNDTIVYEDEFNYEPGINDLFATGLWEVEDNYKHPNAPEIANNVLKMTRNTGVAFKWSQVNDVGTFDSTTTYKFEFDATIKAPGGGQGSRVLYFAPGGYHNQVSIEPGTDKIVIGGGGDSGSSTGTDTYSAETYSTIHIKMEWTGKEIKSVLTKADGTTVEGCRIKSDYNNNTNQYTRDVVIRCEDGEVDVDNFTFSVDGEVLYEQDFEKLNFLCTDKWDLEAAEYAGGAPEVENGVVKMKSRDSIQFNWTKIPGFEDFDNNVKTQVTTPYTLSFDVKVNTIGSSGRPLYVAPGGYFNQLEFLSNGNVKFENNASKTVAYSAGKTYHVEIVWNQGGITSYLYDGETLLKEGTRSNNNYASLVETSGYMKFWVLRCEEGEIEIDNFKFITDDTVVYEENFDASDLGLTNTMLNQANNIWAIGDGIEDAQAPYISNGVAKMHSKTSLQFNWKNILNIGEYNKFATYTFEFDANYRNYGTNGWWWGNIGTSLLSVSNNESSDHQHIALWDKDGRVYAGSQYITWDSTTLKNYKNTKMHMKMVWTGNTVVSTVTDADGKVIVTGSKTVTVDSNMDDFTLRCEDGSIEIDNVKFTKELKYETAEHNISIPEGKQAVYECDITYSGNTETFIKMSGKTADSADASGELFKISDEGMFIDGYACAGEFGEGTYRVKVFISPEQKATMVEVTLPNGGVVRRGSYKLLFECTSVEKIVEFWISNAEPTSTVKYEDNGYVEYVLDTTEPEYEGFEANVYNLVTAFDVDAKTTRTFAWTALESYVGEQTMAVQYRVKGTDEWEIIDAVKEIEDEEYETEDYFKADITGLTAGTTYEYRIGTGSEWGKTYTFTTEAENVDIFSFVAIGDSQISNWDGTKGGADTRGAMFAQAALKQAVEETGNPAFIFHTGDVTEHGTNQSHWNYYFKALGDYGKTIPHFAAVGNHDIWSDSDNITDGSAENFDLHFNHPNNGGSDAYAKDVIEKVDAIGHASSSSLVRNLEETTYSFNYGNVHFVVLNTGAFDTAAGPADKIIIEAQTEWLRGDLEENKDAEWTILMMHESLYSRYEVYNRLEGIHEVIEEYGVDLAILGHQHLVTRTYPMKNGEIVSKSVTNEIEAGTGTVYSTIGATAPSRDGWDRFPIVESMHTVYTPEKQLPTYTTVSVNAGEIKMTIKQIDGLVVDEFVIFKEAQEFSGVTLELGGKIGVNFYVPSYHKFSDEAYVEFELEDGEKQTFSIKDAVETKHGVKFTCWVPAKEMADTITATIYDGGEAKDTVQTSVRDYAETIIRQSDSNAEYAKAKPLVNAMLNYGAYAQKLFDYNTDDLANKNDIVVDGIAAVNDSELAQFAQEKQGLENFGYLAGTSLVLKGETKLKMFFEFEEGTSLDGLTFSIGGVQQEYTKSGNYYVVEIADISAHQLDKDYTVTVTAGNQSFDAVTSAMTYCYNAFMNTEDADLHNVARALYLYNQKADEYKNASN